MGRTRRRKIPTDFSKHYTEDEFKFIISILHPFQLMDPIRKNSKKYKNEIRGYRPNNLPIERVTRVYLNHVYRKRDLALTQYFEILLKSSVQSIEKQIKNKIDSAPEVYKKIANNDMECFRKLCELLLETRFKERVDLYFKVIGHQLTKEQIEFCQNDLVKIIEHRNLEKQIRRKLSSEFEQEILELEKRFNEEVANKTQQIGLLEEQINEIKKSHDNELKHKDKAFANLKEKLSKITEGFAKEKDSHKEEVTQMEERINTLKAEMDQQNEEMNKLKNELNMKYEQFNKVVQKKWEETNRDLIQKQEDIRSSINSLNEFKVKKRIEIDQLLTAVNKLPEKTTDKTGLLWIKGIKTKQQVNKITNESDFIDDLSDNLRICGIDSNRVYNVARYVLAAFASNLCPLLVGYNAREVANAISFAICGSGVDILGLPLGFNDSNQLITVANGAISRVVVLENVVDTISESVYLPLIKQNSDKLFIFSVESAESLHLTTNSLLHYMAILDIDAVIGSKDHSDDYIYAMADQEIFNIPVEIEDKERNLRHVNLLDDIIRLSNAAKHKLAEVISIMDRIGSSNSIYEVLNLSIKLLCQNEGKVDEFNDMAKRYEHHVVM